MTKLDETFVAEALRIHPEAEHFINTLASEVRRLEALGGRYEKALEKIGSMELAPVIARQALFNFSSTPSYSSGPSPSEQLAALDEDKKT